MAEIKDLSTTDANNNGTAANAGFPEGMAYSAVNNAARALEGMIARWYKDGNGTLTTGGSSNAYTLTPNRTISAYADGDTFLIEANHTNTGAATLNVSALGAKSIVTTSGAALSSGDIVSGGRYFVSYDGTNFQLVGGISGVARTAGSNTFTGTNIFEGSASFRSDFTISDDDAGASAAPTLSIVRDSATPAASDAIGRVIFYGNDSGGNLTAYSLVGAGIDDPTNGSEDSYIVLQTVAAGTLASRLTIRAGVVVGSATGGDKGAGTINAVAVYDDNTLLTDYVFDVAVEGAVDFERWDGWVPEKGRHDPARRFASRTDDLDPKAYAKRWKANRCLPAFEHKAGEKLSLGEYAQRLIETCEVQAVHIDKLLARIEALEARNGRKN